MTYEWKITLKKVGIGFVLGAFAGISEVFKNGINFESGTTVVVSALVVGALTGIINYIKNYNA